MASTPIMILIGIAGGIGLQTITNNIEVDNFS